MENNGILEILDNVLLDTKEINIKELPTQGYFYPKDFSVSIKKMTLDDIVDYNFNYIKNDFGNIIWQTYKIIRNNTMLGNYKYEDIRSNDLIYLFFEIAKFTTGKNVEVPYKDGKETRYVNFNNDTFNYYDYNTLDATYDSETMQFVKDGYKFSLPTIGCQNCLVNYIYAREKKGEFVDFCYDFLFFLGNKNHLTGEEIDNLIIIFNDDLDKSEISKIRDIVISLGAALSYTLKVNDNLIKADMKIDFEKLFN